MKELTWLDDLKLRASWGQTGNQEISNLARYTIYAPNYGTTDSFGGQSYGTAYDITGSNGGGKNRHDGASMKADICLHKNSSFCRRKRQASNLHRHHKPVLCRYLHRATYSRE